ncbi:MAG: hypothetical protein AABX80_01510 [Nanoarchaeota archaeon]
MNFIKKIFDNKIDNSVRLQFQKFSRGEFRNRALIEAKKSKSGYKIKTSAEFSNELVKTMAEKLGGRKTNVTGAIISTSDLKNEIKFKEIKQFQGVKKYLMDNEMSGKEILELLEKFPKTFFALSFSVGEDVLKIKAKAPKSGKPGKENEEIKVDFCSLKTSDAEIGKTFVFEKPDFNNALIKHIFLIEKIEIPEELKNSKDFSMVREKSKRVGKIIRIANIDGKEERSEKVFGA